MEQRDERYEAARQRVHRLRGFYVHLLVYVAVNAGLLTVNVIAGRPFWFFWPLLGWGIGVVAHGLSVSGLAPFGKDWEEREIREYRDARK